MVHGLGLLRVQTWGFPCSIRLLNPGGLLSYLSHVQSDSLDSSVLTTVSDVRGSMSVRDNHAKSMSTIYQLLFSL